MFIASLTKKWRSDRSAMLGFVEGYTQLLRWSKDTNNQTTHAG
jgi:hypothetical protein